MSKVIVFKNDDGTCGIIIPAPDMLCKTSKTRALVPELAQATQAQVIEWVANKDVPAGKSYRIINRSQIPSDRTFRNAWTDDLDTETVDVNMEAAREIQMESIRKLRDVKLAELDIPNMSAISRGDMEAAASLEAQKQVLRDIPQTFDLTVFSTPNTLKNAIPEELQ